jgi:uncharacterized protein
MSMSRRSPIVVLAVLAVLLVLAPLAAAKDVPFLAGRVNDTANLIPSDQRQRLETKLAQFEQQTGNQVAVLTVDDLGGEDIEGYSHQVASTWKLGQKGKDNGVLLLVSKGDRKMRLEVGYGLEPVLTDLQTSIIQNEVIIPHFKQGDFGGGIEAGVDAILSTIQGKPFQPAPQERPTEGGGRGGPGPFIFMALFALGPFILNAIRSGSWIVYFVLAPILFVLGLLFASPIIGMILVGAWLVLFPILRRLLPKRPSSGRGSWWIGPGGWGGGGWSGGRGGGGSGGGGFSGGGGSFGGGGSSSSW